MSSPCKTMLTYELDRQTSQSSARCYRFKSLHGCSDCRLRFAISLPKNTVHTMGEKSKVAWHYFSIIELFLLPVRFSLLQYFLWENTAIIRWPPPLLPLICCLSFHELDINVSRQFYLFKDFLNVTEYSEVVAKNYCSLRTHDCRFKFETQVAATTNGFILTSK